MNLQCTFKTPLCAEVSWWPCVFRSQTPKGKLQMHYRCLPSVRAAWELLRYTIIWFTIRGTHAWGSQGGVEGQHPHQGGVSTQIQCPQVSVICKMLDTFRVAWILHSSLGIQDRLMVETRNWATGIPNTVDIFVSLFSDGWRSRGATHAQTNLHFLWWTTSRLSYTLINWCCSSVTCSFWPEVQRLILVVWIYFAFTQTVLICRILIHMPTSVLKVPLHVSHPQFNRQVFMLLRLLLIGNYRRSKMTALVLWRTSENTFS